MATTTTTTTAGKTTADWQCRTIVVLGATGAQGGAVIRAMMGDKKFKLRAATRNPDSEKAKALVKLGVEVVKLDMDDKHSCRDALKGAYGCFLVTNYWEVHDESREVTQGKHVVDACKDNHVKHLVFSGLKSAKDLIKKSGCDHFESKKAIHDCIVRRGIPCTTVDLAFYYENLLNFMKPRKNDKNEYVMDIPMGHAPLDMVCCEDTGEIVHHVFLHPEEFIGKWLPLCSSRMTIDEYAAAASKVVGRKFIAGNTTVEDFAKLGFKGAGPTAVMFEFFASGKYDHDMEMTRKLNPKIRTFEQWVTDNRAAFETEFP